MTIKITWFGTAAYILDLDGTKLLFDPFFLRNDKATPVLKTKRESIENISAEFITHSHFDHAMGSGWFSENLNIPIYCSETAKKSMANFAQGNALEGQYYPLSEKGINNMKIITANDKIEIGENVIVEVLKSKHIRFDRETINFRIKNKEFRKKAKELIPYSRKFPMGEVFAFCTYFQDKQIISFGSLCHKFPDILKKHENCDIFFIPLAGNSTENLARKGGMMVDVLKPKIIVPIHWDDFFPPISRTENIETFCELVKENYPNIKIIIPKIDEELTLM